MPVSILPLQSWFILTPKSQLLTYQRWHFEKPQKFLVNIKLNTRKPLYLNVVEICQIPIVFFIFFTIKKNNNQNAIY